MSKGMLQEIVVVLLVVVLVMLLLLQLPIVQKVVHGNSATATTALKCSGNSATATKLQTARKISLTGAISGNASFDGSGDIVINTENNNFSLIEHTISVGARSTSEDFLNFPSGFTRDNCMVVSWSTEEVHTSYSDINFNGSIVNDHYDAKLFFYYGSSPTIRIKVDNTQQSYNTEVKFRILLMKI